MNSVAGFSPNANPGQSPADRLLNSIRNSIDAIKIESPQMAHWYCKLIPAQCPFERDVKLLGHTLFHIPPMCKINPVYDQLMGLRFRALSFLADVCGEDIASYC